MARRPRRNHSPAFKAKVASAAIQGERTLAEWARQSLGGAAGVFGARKATIGRDDRLSIGRQAQRLGPAEAASPNLLRAASARASIGRYLAFYNSTRPHAGPIGQTPDQAYISALQPIPAAAQPRRKSTWRWLEPCSNDPSHLCLSGSLQRPCRRLAAGLQEAGSAAVRARQMGGRPALEGARPDRA